MICDLCSKIRKKSKLREEEEDRVKKMAFASVEINKSKQSYDNKKRNTYKNLKKLFFLYFINSNKSSFDTNYR